MRSRIAWLVAGTTSAVVLSFVIPLCLLVRTLAEDRAMAAADQEARNVAILVSTLDNSPELPQLVEETDSRGPARTTLLLEDDQVLGSPATRLEKDPEVLRARKGESFSVIDESGGRILLSVVVPDGTEVVRSVVPPAELHRGVRQAWASIIGLGGVLLLVALLLADRIASWISRPVRAVAGTADELRAGNLQARANIAGPPETRQLARALNGLADRIRELLDAERAAVGDLSHRLRTPVTALRLDSEQVSDPELAARLQAHLTVLQRDIDAIVRDARRPVAAEMSARGDLVAAVQQRVRHWAPLAEDQGRALSTAIAPGPLWVASAQVDLRDLVDILIDNVFAHTAEGVPFEVLVRLEAGVAVLVIRDHGAGMAAAAPPGSRPGSTGLGLDIARRTVAAADGSLTIAQGADGGTTVRVSWPLVEER